MKLCLVLLVATACGSESASPTVTLHAYTSDESIAAIGASRGGIRVDSVWISVDRLRFAPAPCGDFKGYATKPLSSADYTTPLAHELSSGDPETTYCKALIPLVDAEFPLPTGAPPQHGGYAIIMVGRTIGLANLRVQLSATSLELSAANAFSIEENNLVIGFDVAKWFDGVSFAGAAKDQDGWVNVNKVDNTTIRDSIAAQLNAGAALYADVDESNSFSTADILLAAP